MLIQTNVPASFSITDMLNAMSDGAIVVDAQGNISFFNTTVATLLQWNEAQIGQAFAQYYPIINKESISDFTSYKRSEELLLTPSKILAIGQQILPTTHEGLAQGGIIVFNLLPKDTHAAFDDMIEHHPDVIYMLDLSMQSVVYFNQPELLGYETSSLINSDAWMAITYPDDIVRVKAHWNKFLKTASNQNQSVEYRVRRKNDEYEWVLNRHKVIQRDSLGKATKVLLSITTINDRKHYEESLQTEVQKLSSFIENTNDLIWAVDTDFNFIIVNTVFRNLFKNNYKRIITQGDNLLDSLPEPISIEWLQFHKRALLGERFTVEFKMLRNDNEVFYEMAYHPVVNEDGLIGGVSVLARDISERKKTENEILKTNYELDSFVHRASHDLRAPLRSVLGLLAIIKEESDSNERRGYLDLVDKSINKLDAFISDLTNFSRNSRLELTHEKINFQEIIDECIQNLKYMENASNIEIRTEIDEQEAFYSDSVRLGIVLQNLLSNSIKYQNNRSVQPYIIIKIISNAEGCKISIEDNGVGIREQHLGQIFNMFFRASNSSYGSGLGLYIAKQVVEKLNGLISVSSTLGEGTVVNIRLTVTKESKTGIR